MSFVEPSPEKPLGGYWYYVSDEQLAAYGTLSLFDRLKWVDEIRLFTLMARTADTAERQERLRRGQGIVPDGE